METNIFLIIPVALAIGTLAGVVIGFFMRRRSGEIQRGAISIEASTVSGRGAFANRKIKKGEIIERCPAIEVDEGDVGGELVNYVFYGNTEDKRLVAMGYGMLFNHSADPNVAYYRQDSALGLELVLWTLRDVSKGEELFYNYGENWWITRQP